MKVVRCEKDDKIVVPKLFKKLVIHGVINVI